MISAELWQRAFAATMQRVLTAQFCAVFLLCAPAVYAQDVNAPEARDAHAVRADGGETGIEKAGDAVRLETISVSETADDGEVFLEPSVPYQAERVFDGARVGLETSGMLSGMPSVHAATRGNRLQRASLTYRGASAQDVVVRYQGVPINALSDAGADLSLIPVQLVSRARIAGSGASAVHGADGALVDLYAAQGDTPLSASLTASSLGDFSLFGRGQAGSEAVGLDGAVFGDMSPGRFGYVDAQGTRRIREHNGASRVGGQLMGHADLPGARVDGFSLFSRIEREEAGFSEYPSRYRDASEQLWLSLSQVRARFAPVCAGQSDLAAGVAVSHRSFHDVYDNPTSLIGSVRTHSEYLENQTSVFSEMNFIAGSWSQTVLHAGYALEDVQAAHLVAGQMVDVSRTDHVLTLAVTEKMSFMQDRVEPYMGGRTDWKVGMDPQFSAFAGIRYAPHRDVGVFASVSMTGRYPSFDELYYRTEFLRGKAGLLPQRAVLCEAGMRYDLADVLSLSVAGFYNLYWDLIRFLPVTSYLYEASNLPFSFSRGAEISLDAMLWDHLVLSAAYGFADAHTGAQLLAGVPAHTLGASVGYRDDVFDVHLDVSYTSEVPRNVLGTSFVPDKFRLDISADMRLFGGLKLSMSIANLLDDRSSEDVLQRPLPGRHAFVGLRYE